MDNNLFDILIRLQTDKSVVIYLYEELYKGIYFTLINPASGNDIDLMEFLTYDSIDQIKELPIFTKEEFIITLPLKPAILQIPGNILWPRLLDIINTGSLEVAIDPGQSHGIRINNQMILGMISLYGAKLTH